MTPASSVQRASFEGVPLSTLVHGGLRSVPDLVALLRVAVSLVDALAAIHDRGVVHGQIEPRNVLVDVVTGAVRLLGAGAAARLSREGPTLPSGRLEGDLAYISPEQTGRMNRSVDYRSDFYSLGVVLYEMFTRRRPFAMDDPLQLVHAHLARRPAPPHEVDPAVPEALSAVVLKLLAKDVEERYQSHHGVRADLGECLAALERGERPGPFTPGRWDVSARFHIPRRLYGREREVAALLSAFDRAAGGGAEVLCITGYAGIGKSALVREIRRPIATRGGYYLAGKYDQLRRGAPYSALIEAIRDLVRQLLTERAEVLESVRARLREALGDGGRVLTAAIPEVETILGRQGPVQGLPPAEAQNRFNRALGRFLGVFGQPGRPLVLFLDDLQWADSASLDFLQQLVQSGLGHLLVLAAYRDNEVGAGHAVEATFAAMRCHNGGHPHTPGHDGVRLTSVELLPLDTATLMRLVADTLHVSADECAKLATLLHAKTAGNPFFATELLKTLHQEGAITFDAAAGRWCPNHAAIEAAGVTDNVIDLMCRKIGRLSEAAQEVLKEAACIDNTFALETLGVAGGRPLPQVLPAIQEAAKAGLLLPEGDAAYRFLHDRVQQAAYSLIPDEARAATHLRIGRLLLGERKDAELGERLFDVVDQLNRGRARITGDGERLRLARLNLLAGRRAKASAAFEPAYRYLDVGVELLDAGRAGRSGRRAHPDLASALLAGRGECAHLAARFDDAARDFREAMALVADGAAGALERAGILELEMRMHSTRGDHERVIATALEGVRILGFECPERPGKAAVAAELLRTKWRLRGRTVDDLLTLPRMTRPEPALAVRLLMSTPSATYMIRQDLLAMTVFRALDICLSHGNAPDSSSVYLLYGMIVASALGDEATGYELGELGLRLAERFGERMQLGRCRFSFASVLNHWRAPARTNLAFLEAALRDCLESGDWNWAAYARSHLTINRLFLGEPLADQRRFEGEHLAFLQRVGFAEQRFFHRSALRYVECLTGRTRGLADMTGEGFDEASYRREIGATEHIAVRTFHAVIKQQLAYLAGDLDAAEAAAREAEEVLSGGLGQLVIVEYHFWAALTRAGQLGRARGAERIRLRVAVELHLRKLRGWARGCRASFLHKQQLVEAELSRALGYDGRTTTAYERAIRSAGEAGYPHLAALADELAGRFHHAAGRERLGLDHLRSARDGYLRWGALAKVRSLEEAFPALGLGLVPAADTLAAPRAGDVLDLAAVIRTAQAISGEIQLAGLLRRVLTIMVENAGAERAFLILKSGEALSIEASIDGDEVTTESKTRLDDSASLSTAIVHYVVRTGETVLLADAAAESAFIEDDYVRRRRPKSVLASPLLEHGTLVGVLYLENNMAPGAFTPARLELLHILSSQAAISIENARLYRDLEEHSRTLEQKVLERTAELQGKNCELAATLARLRETQAQLVAQDKLASLGSLTAGIAHELKNPLNFITNFAELSLPLADEIEGAIAPRRAALGAGALEQIDAALVDLRVNVAKIHEHGKRADGIIGNMLRHARRARDGRVEAALNAVVAQSVDLAAHGLRAKRPELSVAFTGDYDPAVGELSFSPGELSRVFLNVLDNAFYALAQRQQMEGSGYKPALAVRTRRDGDYVEVRFHDNGTGMPPEVLARICEPFYTTKPAGEGTGLGLSIGHDIVRGHRGEIRATSKPGEHTEIVIVLPAPRSTVE